MNQVEQYKELERRIDAASKWFLNTKFGNNFKAYVQSILLAVRRDPSILKCDPHSIVGSILELAQIGLVPDSISGEAHLVNKDGKCEYIIGYKGYRKIVLNSGYAKFNARAVYEGDEFKYELGLNEDLVHIQKGANRTDPGKITHVYAIAWDDDGNTSFEVMTREQVDKFKSDSYFWDSHYELMAKKLVSNKLITQQLAMDQIDMKSINLDQYHLEGVDQNNDRVTKSMTIIDAEAREERRQDAIKELLHKSNKAIDSI